MGRTVDWETTGTDQYVCLRRMTFIGKTRIWTRVILRRVDYAADGADINITRTVYKDGKVYFADSFLHPLPALAGCV